jgi:O-antigen biosynthesis protein WbqP
MKASTRSRLDQLVALAALLLVWPILLAIGLAIRLDSRGPVLFVQTRVGLDEKPFRLVKFRTMKPDTPELATHLISRHTVTRFGALLRRTKLDELPQLFNVLRGDMSFVGPRPCLPSQVDLIEERRRRGIFGVRPGITGLAQVAGIDMSDPARLADLDELYLTQQGLLRDIVIIAQTIVGQGGDDRTHCP